MSYMLNVSFVVEPSAYGSWYGFMHDKFIPFVKEKEEYNDIIFSRVLSESAVDHYTFSLLVHFKVLDSYRVFKEDVMKEYIEFAEPMFGVKVTHFITMMKKVL